MLKRPVQLVQTEALRIAVQLLKLSREARLHQAWRHESFVKERADSSVQLPRGQDLSRAVSEGRAAPEDVLHVVADQSV